MTNEYCKVIYDLRRHNEAAIPILSAVTGIDEKRLNEIADGALPTYSEEIILNCHR